jgi:flagellar biosynthesis/type III secretory pathway protein FliH
MATMYKAPITVLVGPKEGFEARKKAMEEFYESYVSSNNIPLVEHVKDAIAKKMVDEEKIITDYIELSCEKALCLEIDIGELKKALLYDRRQYENGYADGYTAGYNDGYARWLRLGKKEVEDEKQNG